jgi:60 kDa SS-A/Ro ribonucleoprotein
MVKNLAGGYAWPVDDWVRLERFLILGSENGTYYIGERELTRQNAQAVARCIKADGKRVVGIARDISINNRAAKVDPVLFVLAMCCSADFADLETRRATFGVLNEIARTYTHLASFVSYARSFRGWGRGLREAVANWYLSMAPGRLAYQVVKYQKRAGWSHQDMLRMAHPTPEVPGQAETFAWAAGKEIEGGELPRIIDAYEQMKRATTEAQVIKLIEDHNLTHEMVPTELRTPAVWEALLYRMPMTAMIRNLGKLTAEKVLAPFSNGVDHVMGRLANAEALTKSRVHPWTILNALYWYSQGHGMFGRLTWSPIAQVNDALDAAFYATFANVEPMNKRVVLCIDVSGSMSHAHVTAGIQRRGGAVTGMKATQAAAALALVTARTEPRYDILLFHGKAWAPGFISRNTTLSALTRAIEREITNGTQYAAPILHAANQGANVDLFILLGDGQSWLGSPHAAQAMQFYREKTGNHQAKMVVVNMCSTLTTLADPNDAGIIDVIGFDTNTPRIIKEFAG